RDWRARWSRAGLLWLLQLGFKPSDDPSAPFQLPDNVRIYTELAAKTDSVGKDWENATRQFPLVPPHQLLPIRAPPKPKIKCPYPYCNVTIDGAEDVDSHLASYHFIDEPECDWLTRSPRESKDIGYECSCVYDPIDGAKLNNAPLRMNKKAFFNHIHLKHFYAGVVYYKYPKHILECPVLRRSMGSG
ncbi:hypothetical protein MPER_13066, partial [Moniliophthora perniciosa FA553]